MAQEQPLAKQRLVYSILKFLEKEIQTESNNGERRESIEGKFNLLKENKIFISTVVAVQCLETSFDVSLANPSNDLTYGPPIDLLSIVSNKSVRKYISIEFF
jgi:hypothetical protein